MADQLAAESLPNSLASDVGCHSVHSRSELDDPLVTRARMPPPNCATMYSRVSQRSMRRKEKYARVTAGLK